MTFKAVALLLLSSALVPSVALSAELSCDGVVASASKNTVGTDGTYTYVATAYDTQDKPEAVSSSKYFRRILYKRLVEYWISQTGFANISVETSGMATQIKTCNSMNYAVLYVPTTLVKIIEKQVSSQDEGEMKSVTESIQFERMQ